MTPKDIWSRVTVLTVTHNGGEVIGNMLKTVPSQMPLIVVDNASSDDTLDIVRAVAPQARLILNEVGLGYGNGMNCGLHNVETEFALLVNPDSILSEDAIIKLIEAADQFPDAGLFGPAILNPDGSVELSHDVNLFNRGALGKRVGEIHPEGPLSADFVTGAVMLLRMDAGRAVNFFDREIFLYYEDDDICMRLRKAGYGIVHVPDAVITHIGGGSVRPNRAYYWEKFWHISWSRFYFEKKHRGMSAARSLALKYACRYAFKALGYALVLKRSKAWRDAARFSGAIGFLLGKRASVLPAAVE